MRTFISLFSLGHPLRINEHPHGALCSVCGHTDDIHNEYGYCCVGRVVISGGWNGAPICRCTRQRTTGEWLEELLDEAKAGEITYVGITYETPEEGIESDFVGASADIFKMHYVLNNLVPYYFEDLYITRLEDEEPYD